MAHAKRSIIIPYFLTRRNLADAIEAQLRSHDKHPTLTACNADRNQYAARQHGDPYLIPLRKESLRKESLRKETAAIKL